MSLNAKQTIVANAEGYALTCALPGSGKTHTSVSLVSNLLKKDDHKVVMVTFTRAGAGEMRERVERLLTNEQVKRVQVSTFHSFFVDMYKAAGRKKRIIMGSDQDNIIRMAIKYVDAQLLDEYMDVVQAIDLVGRQMKPDYSGFSQKYVDVYHKYQQLCKKYFKIDLNALSKEVVFMLEQNKIPPKDCSHIIVDEYQDSDDVQYQFLIQHGRRGKVIMTVGDDDQSIYSFRGSLGYTGMVNFLNEFKIKAFVLDTCYRCKEEILMTAKGVIENNVNRVPKEMKSAAGEGGTVSVYEVDDIEHEVYTIGEHIKSLDGKWAILARNKVTLDAAEDMLIAAGYSYRRLDGKSIFENKDIKAVMTMVASLKYDTYRHNIIDTLMFMEEDDESMEILVNTLSSNRRNIGYIADSESIECSNEMMKLSLLWPRLKKDTKNEREIEDRIKELKTVIYQAKGVTADKGGKMFEVFFKMFTKWAKKSGWEDAVSKAAYLLNNTDDKSEKEVDVELSTLHGSKGLEWPNCWIMSLNDATIPGENISSSTLEEERRLFYVGMTRAEKNLRISYHKKKASCFIGELTHSSVKFKRAAPLK